jgi:hypothetical protein
MAEQKSSVVQDKNLTRAELKTAIETILAESLPERHQDKKQSAFTNNHANLPKHLRYIKVDELAAIYKQLQHHPTLSAAIIKLIAQRNYYADNNKILNQDIVKIAVKVEQYRQSLAAKATELTEAIQEKIKAQNALNYAEKKLADYEKYFRQFIRDLPDLEKSEILQLTRAIENAWRKN